MRSLLSKNTNGRLRFFCEIATYAVDTILRLQKRNFGALSSETSYKASCKAIAKSAELYSHKKFSDEVDCINHAIANGGGANKFDGCTVSKLAQLGSPGVGSVASSHGSEHSVATKPGSSRYNGKSLSSLICQPLWRLHTFQIKHLWLLWKS